MSTQNLGPLEQEIMGCLWKEKNVSVSDVHKCLQKKRKIAYTTIMTIMTRLTEKGFLTRKMKGKAYVYSPKKTKEQTAKGVIKSTFYYSCYFYNNDNFSLYTS